MTEYFFALVASWGLVIVALSAYFSCLAVPVPTSAVMLAGGAFAAAGDMVLWQVCAAAYIAALAGDQTGFQLGRLGGNWLNARVETMPRRAALYARAKDAVDQWGGTAVFFSTWAVAPLGPWVNFAAGAAGLGVWRFTILDALGEAIWVSIYVALGYSFASNLDALASLLADWGVLLTAVVIAVAAAIGLMKLGKNRG
ncbi:DedA family protein [Litoreibacter janthinus]|uniref:Membrane protein DedA, SNARE-associated domain n=1 Tax=Litoreibacter janthinus TaxID=670154 RepID=A0A1I6GR70_9RHOB|nr:VTT domain-containing protein [Litoreibacter janthinus]SFR44722.1 membrane protein DedA, SNARE-associated domain [Litoreibacter janthinus]